jgi:flagellar biosynthesis protein FliQ
MGADMENKGIASSLSIGVAIVLFVAVLVVGLTVLVALLFASTRAHGADFTDVPALVASWNTLTPFASCSARHFSGGSIS